MLYSKFKLGRETHVKARIRVTYLGFIVVFREEDRLMFRDFKRIYNFLAYARS